MTRRNLFKRILTGILAVVGLSKTAKARNAKLMAMPYKNYMIGIGEPNLKRYNLEWENKPFGRVKSVPAENGEYIVWECPSRNHGNTN